uniref:Superoxide dismutase [Cu-Zn] n=1 Tax=Sordaria fimicola TaxID=27338 RepID=A0A0A0UT49_SORFI|nr:superoxide dismutase-1 [Sordaria fimicola]
MVKAVAVLRGDSNVKGTVIFEQESESAPTTITYDISGNDPNAKRGFHIHTFGDNTNGCTSAGPHCKSSEIRVPGNGVGRGEEREEAIIIAEQWTDQCALTHHAVNPRGTTHGNRTDEVRHVGDLGNLETDAQGNAKGSVTDNLVKLIGPESVIGRTVVVHAGTDDLGKGGNEEPLKTGNAGPRPACGVIGISQ